MQYRLQAEYSYTTGQPQAMKKKDGQQRGKQKDPISECPCKNLVTKICISKRLDIHLENL